MYKDFILLTSVNKIEGRLKCDFLVLKTCNIHTVGVINPENRSQAPKNHEKQNHQSFLSQNEMVAFQLEEFQLVADGSIA